MDTTATIDPAGEERQPVELEEGLGRIYTFLEQLDIEAARVLIKELEAKWPENARVQHYARVLAPAKVIVRETCSGRPLDAERAWLRAHAREYPGCWLAVHKDTLIAADPSLDAVLRVAHDTVGPGNVVLWFQQ